MTHRIFHGLRFALLALTAAALAAPIAARAQANDPENTLIIELETGNVVIELLPSIAPQHVARIKKLARAGDYDGVIFHRVIGGFMAQTGDVKYGNARKGQNLRRAGTGDSELPDLKAEFTNLASFERGAVGMARGPGRNSANSQFFIMLAPAPHLNGQYTIWGRVVEGMANVDAIPRGEPPANPARMIRVYVEGDE